MYGVIKIILCITIFITIVALFIVLLKRQKEQRNIETIVEEFLKQPRVEMKLYYPPLKEDTYKQKIPKQIIQIYTTNKIPEEYYNKIMKMREDNPEYAYYFFSFPEAEKFVEKHLGRRYIDAIDSVIPEAYKADMFRYCILYVMGGVYMDFSMYPVKPLRDIISENYEVVISTEKAWIAEPSCNNSFLASVPRNPLIFLILQESLHNIENKYYGSTPFSPTGPRLVGKIVRNYISSPTKKVEPGVYSGVYIMEHKKLGVYTDKNGEIILIKKYDGIENAKYRGLNKEVNGGKNNHYLVLWDDRAVYK